MKVHLSAVCGTAMASLAGLLRARGDEVTGSDQDVYPPMSTQLEALGMEVRSPYAEANVPADADLVVIGNALSRGNPEVEVVQDRREGERRQEKEEKGKRFHRIEREYGSFLRRVALPTDVDGAKADAKFENGVLSVHLPKSAAAKPRSRRAPPCAATWSLSAEVCAWMAKCPTPRL